MLFCATTDLVKVRLPVLSPEGIWCGHERHASLVSESEPPVSRAFLEGQSPTRKAESQTGQGSSMVGVVQTYHFLRPGGRERKVQGQIVSF